MKYKFLVLITALISINVFAQKAPFFPDIKNYYTLHCDFHTHTIFSDGLVWPDLRVTEALKDNLDVIAITDHIEYRPYQDEVQGDHNRSYEIASKAGKEKGIIVIKGTELTRSMPPGHLNALFIKDANKIETDNAFEALEEAKSQGGFIIWNHPGWKVQQPDTTIWFDIHTKLYEKDLINGIEIFNYSDYYPEALQWANEKDLTMFANSDVHQTIRTGGFGNHRPITLVFAKDYSSKAVEDALINKRTACYFKDTIVAFEPYLGDLLNASLLVNHKFNYESGFMVWSFTNLCSCPIKLKLPNPLNIENLPNDIIIEPNSSKKIRFKNTEQNIDNVVYLTTNWFSNLNTYGKVTLPLK
ncbi:MAG: PHP domain-containing protein [Bacteroidales bacterium]|nr:PHP domain-containing protein [Bacteroidales bacterium]